MNSKENFIKVYEEKIKPLRESYYKNKVRAGLGDNIFNKSMIIINYLPLILALLLCLVGQFSLKSKIIALLFLLVSSYVLSVIKKKYDIYESRYEIEIRKLGFLSIAQYEKNIKKFITGKDGYYAELLQEIIDKNKIAKENSYFLTDLKGRTYILFDNKEKDEILIVNNDLKETPRLTKLRNGNIRYYRNDQLNNRIIFKTDLDEWYYVEENESVFEKIMPEKKVEAKKDFNVNEYISDFERFMKQIKDKDLRKKEEGLKTKTKSKANLTLLLALMIILIIISPIYKEYTSIINIIFVAIMTIANIYLQRYLQVKNIVIKNDNDYIKFLNNNKDCQDKFVELKLALNIPKTVEKIYSDEGAEFLVWDNAGYFHLFLNLIYFDVIYISVKIEEVEYYKEDDEYCEIKIRNNKYTFKNDAKKVFDKLLPNKDYNWIKGLNIDNK